LQKLADHPDRLTQRFASRESVAERKRAHSVTVAEGFRSKNMTRRLGGYAIVDTLGTGRSDSDHLAAGVLHAPLL